MKQVFSKHQQVSAQTNQIARLFDVTTRRNTTSSVEQQYLIFPGISLSYDTGRFTVGAKTNVGYYFLEIDDDVPRTRGYDRGDFINKTFAYSLSANTHILLGNAFGFNAAAQAWADNDAWLEQRYKISMTYDSNDWIPNSVFKISIEHTRYNLDHYALIDTGDPAYIPILPWNKDTMVRAYIIFSWN